MRNASNLLRILAGLLLISNCFAGNQQKEALSADVQASLHSSIINPVQPHLVFANKDQAEAWLTDMSNRLKKLAPKNPLIQDDFMRKRLLTVIQYEATRAALNPQLVLSIITIESKFNKYAISGAGAQGIMQVMPFWLKQIGGSQQDLLNVQTNVRFGCTILRYYIQREHGDLDLALGRYNGSRGRNVYPNLVYRAYERYWQPATVLVIKHNSIITTNYASN